MNNFAITSAGIGEALQRSASALYTAGNTIDESIALVTAANSVIQNPEQVGTALKTMALRLRGAKVELEEAGLETDNMAESTSTLQAKLEALTHGKVDIMIDADTFKSTTQILREMSTAWEDMTDIERASALELMGGKRQANILSSLITNFETVEDVIETSMNSSGSAMAENAKWLDSIEGKSKQLASNMQAVWEKTFNTDVVKYFYDLAIGASELATKFGLIPPILAGILVYFKAFKNIGPISLGKGLLANIGNYSATIQQVQQMTSTGLAGMTMAGNNNMLNAQSVNTLAGAVANYSARQQAAILTTNGLSKAQAAQVLMANNVKTSTINQLLGQEALNVAITEGTVLTGEQIAAKLAEQGVTLSATAAKWLEDHATEELTRDKLMAAGATGQEIMALLGLTGAANGAAFSIKGLATAFKVMFKSNPVGWILTFVSVIAMIVPKIKQVKTESIKAAEETVSAYQKAQKTLQDQKRTIDELSKSYERLSKGVNLNTNENISLTTSSYEEYLDICNDIADMYPHLVTGFDAQGNAILSLRGNVDELIQAYNDAAQSARQAMIAGGKDVFDTFKNTYNSDALASWETAGLNQQVKLAKKLQELMNNSSQDEINEFFNNLNSGQVEIDGEKYSNVEFDALVKGSGLDESFYKNGFVRKSEIDIEVFKQQSNKLLSFIKSKTTQINTETSKVKSLMDAYLGEDLQYSNYSNKTRAYIDQIVSSLDADFISGFDSADALYNHIKTNIVDVFKDPSITNALSELSKLQLDFNKGDISYADYQAQLNEYIGAIQNKFDSETLEQIKVGIGIDETSLQTAENHIATMVDGFDDEGKIIQDVQNKINSLSVEDLQIAGQLEVPEGTIYTWDELIAKIKEAKIAATQDFDITAYKESITGITENISSYQEAIQKLDKGSFTLGDFMELIAEMPELARGVDVSSKSFSGLRSNLQQAIKTSTKSFVRDLKELKYRLQDAGKSTEAIDQLVEAVENMPDNALDNFVDKYGTLADEIERAVTAQNKLSESMGEEETGYETRGEAMEYMKGKLEEGKIGSESNVWNVAEQYGFTYDSAKTLNENADALAKYIAVRERWFKEADDGDGRTDDGYAFEGIENFIQDVETATEKSEELQKYLSWTYDDSTGTLNFDFDNENLDTIIQSLSKTEQFAGLTKEEFIDMIRWVGQYFNINWGDNDDILNYLDGVATSAKDAKTKVEEYGAAMQKYLGGDTTIDLTTRPMISKEKMQEAGWKNFDGTYGTTYSSTYTSEDGQKSIVVTPILPDGSVLSPEELDGYAKKLLNGEEIDPEVNIKLGEFNGADSQKQADEYAQTLSKAQAQYDQLRDTLSINTTLDNKGVDGLKEIKELQETITTNSEGVTVIDPEAFTKALKDAGYAQDQIDLIIDKIKKLNSESFNSDVFKIDETLVNNGVSGLQKIQELQNAIKESSSGWTVVDTDMFTSVLQGAGYTKTQIDELIKKVQEYNGVILTSGDTDPLGLENWGGKIEPAKASLEALGVKYSETVGKWGDGLKDIKIDVPDLVTALKAKGWSEEAIRNYCTQLSQTSLEGFQIKVDSTAVDEAIKKANEMPEEKIIETNITGNALSTAEKINDELSKMKDKTITTTINEVTNKTEKSKRLRYNSSTGEWETYANGTAHATGTAFAGGNWGAPSTETALVGELGPELLVRGNRWTTIGENGAEFTQVKKGDIIFNHKQTESLLKNGYVTSRGKAYASGTAYANTGGDSTFAKYSFSGNGGYTKYDVNNKVVDKFGKAADKLSNAADKTSDAADDFEETFDWIEVRLEEINEKLSLKEAKLENAVDSDAKNKIIDSMIDDNKLLYNNLIAGSNQYYAHAQKILSEVPAQFRDAAKNGSIAITEFKGKVSEEGYNAIQEYREWVQKGADLTQQAEETLTEIASLARQKFDNTEERWDLKVATRDDKNAKIEAAIDLAEAKGEQVSTSYYDQLIANTKNKRGRLVKKRDDMQADLDSAVKSGDIKKYSNEWYEMVSAISSVDEEIIQCDVDIEDFKNEMDDIRWDNLDTVIERLDNISDEAQSLIDILSEKDLVDENGAWTNEGIASLGLYAQEMENAKLKASEYADGIYDLQQQYKSGAISESEYAEKLAELKKGQYDSIKAYNDSKKAIVDLQKTRVEAIKKGIDKEIEAYQELIEKKKEALDADKDAHDFTKSAMEHQKNISDIERRLAALAGDTSMSARAERARLEAELAEAKAEQEEFYYDRSVSNQQEAFDKELENFQETKEAEKEGWDEWLEDTTAVVGNAFETLQTNAKTVNATLTGLAEEYGLKLSDAIVSPWKDGQTTMDAYWSSFTTLGSDAITALDEELDSFVKAWEKAQDDAHTTLEQQNQQQQTYTQAEYQEPQKPTKDNNGGGNNGGGNNGNTGTPKVGSSVTVKKTATNFGSKSGGKKMASFVPGGTYTVYEISGSGANAQVLIGKNGAYTGWVKVSDLTGYTAQSGNGNNGNPGNNTQYTTYTVKSGDTLSHIALDKLGSASKWKEIYELNKQVIGSNPNAIRVGQKLKIPKYAKGTLGIDQSQLAWIDELGEELVLQADGNGRLKYMTKGSSVIPHDLTENLMSWGELDPSNMLEQNRPSIGVSPEIHNTEINLDCSVGTLVNIEHCDQGTLPDVEKMVNKAFEKHMQTLNNSIKKYVR